MQQRFAALKAQADSALAARQDKLAQKLHAEEQALKQELINCQETPAQRRAQMAARAHELARRREAERQQLAAALMDQAFRDNCDPLRERNSKRLVYRTVQEREQQVRGVCSTPVTGSACAVLWHALQLYYSCTGTTALQAAKQVHSGVLPMTHDSTASACKECCCNS